MDDDGDAAAQTEMVFSVFPSIQVSQTLVPGGVTLDQVSPAVSIPEGTRAAGTLEIAGIRGFADITLNLEPTAIDMKVSLKKFNLGGVVVLQAGPSGEAARRGPFADVSFDSSDPISTEIALSAYGKILGISK